MKLEEKVVFTNTALRRGCPFLGVCRRPGGTCEGSPRTGNDRADDLGRGRREIGGRDGRQGSEGMGGVRPACGQLPSLQHLRP